MTLQHLYEQVAPTLPASMRKDLQTAVRVLSRVLQYADPQSCPLDTCRQPLPTLTQLVDAHLTAQGKGRYTIRNTKNLLRRLLREATAKGLLTLPSHAALPRFPDDSRPPRPGSESGRNDGTYLAFAAWPAPLQQEFREFYAWATRRVVPGREAGLHKRPSTLRAYRVHFEMYFGFLRHVRYERRLTFNHLFDLPRLNAFFHWHINVKHRRVTRAALMFLSELLALTRQYRPQPALRAQLQALRRTLPRPAPTYEKGHAWVPLRTQEQVGLAIWPVVPRCGLGSNGRLRAVRAGISLAFRLWRYIPLRSRNMREMRLTQNLHKAHGVWRLRFTSEELKVTTRRGRPNGLDVPFPAALIPTLEHYLEHWRPLLTFRRPAPQEVLLTMRGHPFSREGLRSTTSAVMYRYTGQHWHPHIVRTVWATEWIKSGGDFATVAIMLNNTMETVIRNYSYLLDEGVVEKAYQWVEAQLPPGPRA